MTLGEATTLFRETLVQRNYSDSTKVGYRKHLDAFFSWLGDGADTRPITSITKHEIERFQDHLAEGALAKQTQAVRIRAIKRFFEMLVDRGHLFVSPARSIVETPVGMKTLPEVLTVAEVKRMLATPDTSTKIGIRDRAVLELLYDTGMRRGELAGLDLGDVDLDGGTVKIRSGKGRIGRLAPLGQEASRWLSAYLKEARPALAKNDGTNRALFLSKIGTRLDPELVRRTVKLAARAAKIEKRVYTHTLRHSVATHLVQNGADIVTVQKLLGHATAATTSAIYTRVAPVELKRAHQKTHPREREKL